MRTAIARFALVLALFASCGIALGQDVQAPTMEDDVRTLLEVTGSGELALQVMNQMVAQFKQAAPNAPETYWDEFMAKVDKDELADMVVPIYVRHFTHDEIKGLLDFYQTPLGKKVIATLPAVMQESMIAGQEWGARIGQEVVDDLKAKGHL